MELSRIAEIIKEHDNIGITYHVSPDGDAIGSALALLQCLKAMKKKAYMLSKDSIPDNMAFLPYSEEIDENQLVPISGTKCVIALDCGNFERLSVKLENYNGLIINIDHHISNEKYGDYNYVDDTAAATAEIVYELIEILGVDIDLDIAKCLYTSLVTDTGSFRHSNTTKRTHYLAGNLIEKGLDTSKIHSSLFDNKPYEKFKLLSDVLNDMEIYLNNKVVVLKVTNDLIEKHGLKSSDASDMVSIGMQIKGTEVSLLIKEADLGAKISLRSKNEVDVRKVAEKFGGGGHIKAAGAIFNNKSIEEVKNLVLKELKEELI